MPKRLVCIHYTTLPQIGGLEIAASQLARAVNEKPDWEAILITGTPKDGEMREQRFTQVCIPEMNTNHHLARQIYEDFRVDKKHPAVDLLMDVIYDKLNSIIKSGDLLVSFNIFSVCFSICLSAALWKLTMSRKDIRHLTWCFDLEPFNPLLYPTLHDKWPWRIMAKGCPSLIYATSSPPLASEMEMRLNLPSSSVRVIPAGLDPQKCLRITDRIYSVCKARSFLSAYPLLFMPAKISVRKNIPLAIDAMSHISQHFPNAHLVVAGSLSPHDIRSTEVASSIGQKIMANHMNKFITVLGQLKEFNGLVSHDDTMSMLAICDGLLFTSTQEGFLIPVLEANLYNVPVFVPAHENVLSWGLEYVNPYPVHASPHQIARAVSSYFEDMPRRRKHTIRTRFSWEFIFDTYINDLQ